LLKGDCTDTNCRFSHTLTDKNMPICQHFERGRCTKDPCPYLHVKHDRNAPVCRPFATEGYCELGGQCKRRHVFLCPDFAAGSCTNKGCRLKH
ncbi:hypothetical protein BDK51DRAFT_1860, partial [Blyttiomyces helicus]